MASVDGMRQQGHVRSRLHRLPTPGGCLQSTEPRWKLYPVVTNLFFGSLKVRPHEGGLVSPQGHKMLQPHWIILLEYLVAVLSRALRSPSGLRMALIACKAICFVANSQDTTEPTLNSEELSGTARHQLEQFDVAHVQRNSCHHNSSARH